MLSISVWFLFLIFDIFIMISCQKDERKQIFLNRSSSIIFHREISSKQQKTVSLFDIPSNQGFSIAGESVYSYSGWSVSLGGNYS